MSPVPAIEKPKPTHKKQQVNIHKHSEYSKWKNTQSDEYLPSETEWSEQQLNESNDDDQIFAWCDINLCHHTPCQSISFSPTTDLCNHNQAPSNLRLRHSKSSQLCQLSSPLSMTYY